jgi:glutathione S-transferase
VPFENKLYTDPNEWFGKDKIEVSKHTPFANLPYLKDGDFYLSESRAILEYVAAKYSPDLLGKDAHVHGRTNEVLGVLEDIFVHVSPILFSANFETEKGPAAEKFKGKLEGLVHRLSKHDYIAADYITIADFRFYE